MKRSDLLVLAISALLLGGMPPRSSAQAPSFALELPIDCALPDRCAVQFHVDRRQGPEVGDFRCGRLSYDTHRGTDFRVFAKEDFDAGIPVLAAAPGKVVAIRDGMEDIDVVVLGRDKIQGRAGGNQVVIAHDDGWETYYWHLRKGSIAVLQGQTVVAGTKLGLVGLSGDTNFPHLHFELRRNRSVVVDPFDATDRERMRRDGAEPVDKIGGGATGLRANGRPPGFHHPGDYAARSGLWTRCRARAITIAAGAFSLDGAVRIGAQ